jgi:hypothetical protein
MVVSLITSFREQQINCGTFRISRSSQEFSSLKVEFVKLEQNKIDHNLLNYIFLKLGVS